MATGIKFLKIVAPFYMMIVMKLVTDGVLRGSGAVGPFMVATFSDLILRVLLAYLFSIPFGATGIWMSWPIGWAMGTVLSLGFYIKGVWKVK
jgi:Na+-driven multidrug efflux pump